MVLDGESAAEKWIANKKLRSKVWNESDLKLVEGSVKAICKHCKTVSSNPHPSYSTIEEVIFLVIIYQYFTFLCLPFPCA
jgi:hypothetical protein